MFCQKSTLQKRQKTSILRHFIPNLACFTLKMTDFPGACPQNDEGISRTCFCKQFFTKIFITFLTATSPLTIPAIQTETPAQITTPLTVNLPQKVCFPSGLFRHRASHKKKNLTFISENLFNKISKEFIINRTPERSIPVIK